MGPRQEIEKKVRAKTQELQDLESQRHKLEIEIEKGRAFLQAYEETLKILKRQAEAGSPAERSLRPGSSIAKARDAIKHAGKPLHIIEILKALGRPPDKKNRLSLSGSLAHYVRRGEIFTRPAANTFGLAEFEQNDLGDLFDDGEKEDDEPSTANGKVALK